MQQTTNIDQALQQHFGFTHFNQGQRAVIECLMNGQSALALFPTGGGKSLCYQLPALLLPGLTLVVSPLIALMKDQIDALKTKGIAAARLDSSLSAEEYREVLNQTRSGSLRLLYVAPERFNNERFRSMIVQIPIALLAIDEAHCISEWGHNFRPDYLKLPEFAKRCNAERVLTLTATATRQVQEDICRAFDIAPACAIRTGFYRSNLTMLTTPVSVDTRDEVLQQRLQTQAHGPTIVYVTLQRTAEHVAEQLCKVGFSARAYHAGLKDELRVATQEWFMASDTAIVVATIAFGMGVDKANIRYVYHYNLPKSLENYAQEVGRAGRDGLASVCEMLVCVDDLNVLENFIYGDTPTQSSLQSLVHDVFTQGDNFDVSMYELSTKHDIRPLVLRTLLTYLELESYLQGGTAFYADYSFKPLLSSEEILAHFEGERHTFLSAIFGQAKKAKTWFNIDIEQAVLQLGSSRERIIRALDYLADQNMLAVKVSGVRNPYRLIKTPDDLMAMAEQLHQRALKREQSEISRLQQVLDLVGLADCQVNALASHFDDHRKTPCGHCSWCLHQTAVKNIVRAEPQINQEIWTQALKLREEKKELSDAISLVRFLCGVTSPHLSRAKLSRHALFGALAHIPFQTLIKHANKAQSLS